MGGEVYDRFVISFIAMWVNMCVLLLSVLTCVFLFNKLGHFVDMDVLTLLLLMGTCYDAWALFIFDTLW